MSSKVDDLLIQRKNLNTIKKKNWWFGFAIIFFTIFALTFYGIMFFTPMPGKVIMFGIGLAGTFAQWSFIKLHKKNSLKLKDLLEKVAKDEKM